MSAPTPPDTQPDTGFLLTDFTNDLAHVDHAIAVSADGLLLAHSADLPRDRADQLAAAAAGLVSLTQGTAQLMDTGHVHQTIVETDTGFLLLMSIGGSGSLVVLAGQDCDVGHLGYATALLVERVGNLLKPATRDAAQTTS